MPLAPWDKEQEERLRREKIEQPLAPKISMAGQMAGENLLTQKSFSREHLGIIFEAIRSEKFGNNTKRYLQSLDRDELNRAVNIAQLYAKSFDQTNQQDELMMIALEIINLAKKIKK